MNKSTYRTSLGVSLLSLLSVGGVVADTFEARQLASAGSEYGWFRLPDIDKGFDLYQQAYEEEFKAYKNEITQLWGEFIDPGPETWVSYVEGNQVRRKVDFEMGTIEVSLLLPEKKRSDEVRGRVNLAIFELLSSTEADAYQADPVAQGVEQRLMTFPSAVETGTPSKRRLFAQEDLAAFTAFLSPYQKVSTRSVAPVKWEITQTMNGERSQITARFVIPHSVQRKAKRFADDVTAAAVKERLPPELILAIIETESSFNPMARSHIPAYGLMQIVPRSSGRDATQYLYGKARILAPSYLYEIDKNIRVGSAYLHVLYYRYMKKIKNPISRLYCVIAAYNTGPSNVGAAFTGKKSFSGAVKTINKMNDEEVYKTLITRLRYKETRNYVKKVATRMRKYVKNHTLDGEKSLTLQRQSPILKLQRLSLNPVRIANLTN